jgi:hypothetical protein
LISNQNKYFFSIAVLLFSFTIGCTQADKVDKSKAESNLLLGLVAGQQLEASKEFILNGQWNSFTGNQTTGGAIQTYTARANLVGLILTDGSGYSVCSILNEFDNSKGIYLYQNPENNGACFTPDNNKGKYFKVVFFKNSEKDNSFWYCTLNGLSAANSLAAARDIIDTSSRTSPSSNGCGGFSWNRLDKK